MKKPRLIRSKKGAGLIEVVVGAALLALIAVFIVTVFASSVNFVYRNAASKQKDKQSSSGLENAMGGYEADGAAVERKDGALTVDFGGVLVEIDGQILESTDPEGEFPYYYYHAGP